MSGSAPFCILLSDPRRFVFFEQERMFGWFGNKQQQEPPRLGAAPAQAQRAALGGGNGLAARGNASAMPPPGVPAGRPAVAAPRAQYPRPPVPGRSRVLDSRPNDGREMYSRPISLWQRIKDIPDDIALWMINKAMDLSIPTDDLSKYLGVGLAVMGNFILFGVKTSPDPEMKEAEALLICGCAFLSVANFVKVLFTQKQFELPGTRTQHTSGGRDDRRRPEPYDYWSPSPFSVVLLCLFSPVQVYIIHAVPNPANALMGCFVYAVIALSLVSRVIVRENQTRRINGVVYREIQTLQYSQPVFSSYHGAPRAPATNTSDRPRATPVSRTAASHNPTVSPRQLAFSPEGDPSPAPQRAGTGHTPRFGRLDQRM